MNRPRKIVAAAATLAALAAGMVMYRADAAVVPYATAPTNTWGTNGRVLTTAVDGSTLYLGGTFTQLVGPGGEVVPRVNLAALDLTTGLPISAFRADADGAVRALQASGGKVYVGGSFSTLGGVARSRLGAVDGATGAVDGSFRFNANSNVYALGLGGGRLSVGGSFSTLGGQPRSRLAAVDLASRSLTPLAPAVDGTVRAVVSSPDAATIYVGGTFTTVGGMPHPYLAAVDQMTGTVSPTLFDAPDVVVDVDVNQDGSRVYAAIGGTHNQAAGFDPRTGARTWKIYSDGDGQAVRSLGENVYFGFHESFGGDTQVKVVAVDDITGVVESAWRVPVAGYWGVFDITGSAGHLVLAGEARFGDGGPANIAILPAPIPPPPTTAVSTTAVATTAVATTAVPTTAVSTTAVPTTAVSTTAAGGPILGLTGSWAYLASAADLPAGWSSVGFDDSAWPVGPAELGFGDGDEATVIWTGLTPKPVRVRFRRTVEMATVPAEVTLSLRVDDGAAVLVNGVEVVRDNLKPGPLSSSLRAAADRTGAAESAVRTFTVSGAAFRPGTNQIAVEVYQAYSASSDISFALGLSTS